jgi:hypothetical protein
MNEYGLVFNTTTTTNSGFFLTTFNYVKTWHGNVQSHLVGLFVANHRSTIHFEVIGHIKSKKSSQL